MKRLPFAWILGLGVGGLAVGQTVSEPAIKLAEVVVTPSRFGVSDRPAAPAASLTSAELETLPQIGDDLYRSIARLPGLAADDFTAKFWVRGAPNGELLARLDGVELVEPFHLKDIDGALSIIDPQAIRRLDLVTGGFSSEYGNRLAAVLEMETSTPRDPRTSLSLSLTGVTASWQGARADQRVRWLVTGRRGYPDVALRLAHRDDEISPRYYDAMAKVEVQLAPAQTLSLHVLHAGDTMRYKKTNRPTLASGYDSDYAWLRWRGTFDSGWSGEAVASLARLTWDRRGTGQLDGLPFSLDDQRRLDLVSLRNEWTRTLGDDALIRAGFEVQDGSARYDYHLSHQRIAVSAGRQVTVTDLINTRLRPSAGSAGGFASVRWQPRPGLVLEPGLRYDDRDPAGDRGASPRLNASLAVGPGTLRVAWGAYRQSQGLHELAVADGEKKFQRGELAEQRVLGWEQTLVRGVSLRVEAYERLTTRVRRRWENLDNAYDLFPEAQSDRVLLSPNRGRARGVELLVAGRANPRLTWNASYAWAKSEELLAGRWTPRSRDQRHTFYVDATYAPNPRWTLSASWQFHTGTPTTDVLYSLAPLTNGRRLLVSVNGAVYGLRLPDYHRLDLRATRRWQTKHGDVRAFLDLFNAYDRTNLVGYNHRVTITGTTVTDEKKPRDQLPILPSAGVSWEF